MPLFYSVLGEWVSGSARGTTAQYKFWKWTPFHQFNFCKHFASQYDARE